MARLHWNPQSREEFLDIVANKGNLYLTIECKKTAVLTSEKRNKQGIQWHAGAPKRSYVFLRTAMDATSEQTGRTICTSFHEPLEEDAPDALEGTHGALWDLAPMSYEASLCVPVDIDQRELLEHDVANLVRGTHQYADAMYSYLFGVAARITELFVPVYVTTAPLYTLRLDLDRVSIETGEFTLNSEELQPIPWIRFTKAFMAEGRGLDDERTVIVVEAKHFKSFLEQFGFLPVTVTRRGQKPL